MTNPTPDQTRNIELLDALTVVANRLAEPLPRDWNAETMSSYLTSAIATDRRRRIGEDDLTGSLAALAGVVTLTKGLQWATWHAVEAARRNGATWTQVGEALGTTRQNAQQTYRSVD